MKHVISVDMGGTNLRVALMREDQKILLQKKIETRAELGSEKIIRTLVELIQEVRTEKISSVVVGCPGPLDHTVGILYELPNLPDWKNIPLKKILEEKLDLPIQIENDANLAAFGEYTYGVAKGSESLVQ